MTLTISSIFIICKILIFFHPHWFYQGKGPKKWKGGLLKVYSSEGLINEKSYALLSEYYCAEKSTFPSISSDPKTLSYTDAERLCIKFNNLNQGMLAFIVFNIFAVFLWILAGLLLLIGREAKKTLITGFVLVIIQVALEFASLICIVSAPDLTFGNDCSYISKSDGSNNSQIKSCGDDAALFVVLLQLFIIGFLVWVLVDFCVYSCCLRTAAVQDIPKNIGIEEIEGFRCTDLDKPD